MAPNIEPTRHEAAEPNITPAVTVKSQTLVRQFKAAVDRATKFLSNLLKEGGPSLHPEFREISGWNWNKSGLQTTGMPTPQYKIRFFFDATDFSLLNGVHFPVKFTVNDEPTIKAQYCRFAYPVRDLHFPEVELWASRFKHAEVFTYGGEINGKWIPGTLIRTISKTK